ncbi:MAG: type IX secretion system membrane protein PorP/SprF [Bacteroidetes bacterium]|nr:type IX secretion system membrane protein PorP/SprF [Bacteroidota bacterium]
MAIALSLTGIGLYAQQEPQFTQNMFNNMTINPGFAGMGGGICATGIVRQQWASFKDADGNKVGPETFLLTIHSPVKLLRGGIGAVIMQDKLGFEKNINVKVGYSYHTEMGFGTLGIGAMIGFNNKYIDFSKLEPAEPDPLLEKLSGEESEMLIDASLGLFYQVPNQFYIGISANQLLESKGKELASSTDSTGGAHVLYMKLDRTFYINGGYEFVFPRNPSFILEPSLLIKTNFSVVQYDISALLKYNEKFWGGLNYRVQDAVGVIVGVAFKNFKIGYSYDITTSKLGLSRTGGSHEIMVNYCFKIQTEKARKSYKNTRFL